MPASESNYKNVSLPIPLYERVKRIIKENPELGFTSVSNFVRFATIEKADIYDSLISSFPYINCP